MECGERERDDKEGNANGHGNNAKEANGKKRKSVLEEIEDRDKDER